MSRKPALFSDKLYKKEKYQVVKEIAGVGPDIKAGKINVDEVPLAIL